MMQITYSKVLEVNEVLSHVMIWLYIFFQLTRGIKSSVAKQHYLDIPLLTNQLCLCFSLFFIKEPKKFS